MESTAQTQTIPQLVRLYCGIPFKRKDEAKSLGAKWDMEKKAWYFVADAHQIGKNVDIHTFNFKPMIPKIMDFNPSAWQGSSTLTEEYVSRAIYNVIIQRWNNNKDKIFVSNNITNPTTYEIDPCLI